MDPNLLFFPPNSGHSGQSLATPAPTNSNNAKSTTTSFRYHPNKCKAAFCLLLLLVIFPFCLPSPSDSSHGQQHPWSSCNRTRRIISASTWGIISDGRANYTQDSYCEWLIVSPPGGYITLEIQYVRTECSYDYLFVFDGESYTRNSTLLASFSGASDHSVTLLATSGKMLILLYSDTNYALEGFQAQYFVTPCPLNCTETEGAGTCIPVPEADISSSSASFSHRFQCDCSESHTGEGCEIKNKEINTLLLPSRTFPNLLPRVGHSATKVHDKVYIFGGFDLNTILNDLKIYDLHSGHLHDVTPDKRSSAKTSASSNSDGENNTLENEGENEFKSHMEFWPVARFGHASTPYKSGFFIHGGRLEDGSITNELLYFNTSTHKWRTVDVMRDVMGGGSPVPSLIYHSMTLAPSGAIYIYGGGTPNGSFSSKLYRFQGEDSAGGVGSGSAWVEIVSVCCGKAKDRSVLGHSAVFWKNALIIFGGVTVDIGRFSKISSQLWMFLLEDGVWMEIQYKRNSNFNSVLYKSGGGVGSGGGSLPQWGHMERAFHSMNIIGNHLLVIGGYTHSHNKDETCYSNVMLVYNLECQQFLQDLPLRISGGMEQGHGHKAVEGVFGHRTIVFKDRVFILGGYRGYLDGRIRSIPLPFKIHRDHEDDCVYYDKWRCSGDPQCGWCPTDLKCYEKLTGSKNCTTNLQTSQCPGICPLMTSCQSCVILHCSWCDALQQCVDRSQVGQDSSRQCHSRSSISNSIPGTTSTSSGLSVDYKTCVSHYDRQGVTIFEYRNPPDLRNPDQVKVINTTVFRVQRESSSLVDNTGPSVMVMKGFLVGVLQSPRRIELCASQARVNLSMDDEGGGGHQVKNNVNLKPSANGNGEEGGGSGENLTTHLNWSAHVYCMNLTWPSGKPVMLQPDTRIRFEISANTSRAALDSAIRVFFQQRMIGKNNTSSTSTSSVTATRVPKESLIPFTGHRNGSCSEYISCLACVADSLCAWMGGACGSRLGLSLLDEDTLRASSLVIDVDDCFHCSDLTTCSSCVLHDAHSVPIPSLTDDPTALALPLSNERALFKMRGGSCEWWEEESSCQRRGRLDTGVKDVDACPLDCHLRRNCSSCLEGPGKCVWCADRGECFVFDVYTTFYQFGQCIDWMDKAEQCQRCAKQSKCEDCIRFLGCGWNYDDNGGSCTEGDFQGPLLKDDMVVMDKNVSSRAMTWTYGVCPDIDECALLIHDCHDNATCENTPGSYNCKCKQGFTGDGKKACEETCFEPCLHGTCSPNFVCECDLGWTGVDCSVDCGCNNHSSCETGSCEECQDMTEGPHCEYCVRGQSFGNATVQSVGCRPCFCNGHGDEGRGVCDIVTGSCFCLNNTAGPDCSSCQPGYFGDPRLGQPCYKDCEGRAVMNDSFGYFAFSYARTFAIRQTERGPENELLPYEHCMWILKQSEQSFSDTSVKPRKIRISVSHGYNIPCSENALNIYSGIPSFTKTRKDSTLVASVCSPISTEGGDESWPWPTTGGGSGRSARSTLDIYVESELVTVVIRSVGNHSTPIHFNASYKFLRDNDASAASSPSSPSMLTFTLANSRIPVTRLYDGQSVFSRFGHTLHADDKNVWIFGGYSLSHGALNDVRQFSRDIGKWIPLTIFVIHDSVNNEDSVPSARYFHAGAMGPVNSFMAGAFIIHGGLASNMSFLGDTWRFDTRVSRWSKMGKELTTKDYLKLAGHTITLRFQKEEDPLQNPEFVLIGGVNTDMGFSNRTFSMTLDSSSGVISEWEEVATTGAVPVGIYGHTTVYHPPTDSFYVFGGFLYDTGKVFVSSRLFALNWSSKKWTMLPPTEEFQVNVLPVPRFFHSAVTTGSYMVVMGGAGSWHNTSVLAYNYKCNLWTLLEGGSGLVDRTGGAGWIWEDQLLTMGGWDWGMATTSESLFQITLPADICSVQSSGERCKATLGCSYCFSNNNQSQQCYNAELTMPRECSLRPNNTELKIDFKGGTLCNARWMESRNCNQYLTCTECLSSWPSHPDSSSTVCQWCTNCQIGRCIPLGKKCGEENSCSQKQRETLDIGHCPERACSSSECDKCIGGGKCVWTRQILRSSEWSWKLHSKPVYDWNCVRKQIVNTSTSSYKVIASPPEPCPAPCSIYKSCETCLTSAGGEGGFQECRWSLSKSLCVSPAHSHLLCFGGVCGPILMGNPINCPRPCSNFGSCSACLRNPGCGWCAREGRNGEGQCLPGDSISSQTQNCSGASFFPTSSNSLSDSVVPSGNVSWNYIQCPMENECENGHDTCNPRSEKCIDLDLGFECECRLGYMELEGVCVPICEGGCIHGECVAPGVCQCHFGYVGSNCSAQCNCNGHSNCGGVDDLNNCLECMNDTMGIQCSKCKPLFVGDPRNGRPCISCFDYCNGHSNVCVAPEFVDRVCRNNGTKVWDEGETLHRIRSLNFAIPEGPLGDAHCCACQHKTNGSKCDNCIAGFFRGSEDKRKPCRKCECHGHGDTCDPVTGTECVCHNNTESDHCGQNPSKLGVGGCWKSQCAKCRESYFGNPTNGHQCYRHMFVDNEYCFDPKSQEYCTQKPKHLKSGHTVFFAVQPKFMNVNIRINLDVTYGAVHVYLSPKDDTFIISPDQNTWMHQVKFDRKYGLGGEGEPTHQEDHRAGVSIGVGGGAGGGGGGGEGSDGQNVTGEEEGITMAHRLSASFRLIEKEAAGFATHVTLDDSKAILKVLNVRSRLVVTLPQDSHDLRLTRFYIVLEGVGDQSSGSISFRQDQLHIDLFVFFSVFFSAFFLFLAACGIAWKLKQNMETRRARHRHVAEMLSMAKRPFAVWTLILEPELTSPLYQAYTQCRKTCRKGCICVRPLAIEGTHEGNSGVCTMLISLPGGSSAPVRLCLASTLAHLARSYPQCHSRRRRR